MSEPEPETKESKSVSEQDAGSEENSANEPEPETKESKSVSEQDAGSEENSANEPNDGDSVSFWKLSVAAMMIFIIMFIGFIFYRLAIPSKWEFSIEATTEVANINLRPGTETRWLVDGAVICSRDVLELPERYRLSSADSPCGRRAWHAWRSTDPEQLLRLNGGASATLQLRPEGGLAMSLRAEDGASLGGYSVVSVVEDVDLDSAVNLIWTDIPPQSLTLPFSGATTLGRAVSWSDTRLLHGGNVVVYTADESADKRTKVDEAALMLGDQVSLGEPEPDHAWPKGFVRVAGGEDAMQVVAFGRASSLRIERFGESGYDFKPGPIRALAADPAVAFWGSVLAAFMTLILSLQPFVGGGDEDANSAGPAPDLLKRFNRWLHTRPKN